MIKEIYFKNEDKYMCRWKAKDLYSTYSVGKIIIKKYNLDYFTKIMKDSFENNKYTKIKINASRKSYYFDNNRTFNSYFRISNEKISNPLESLKSLKNPDYGIYIRLYIKQNTLYIIVDHSVYDGINSSKFIQDYLLDKKVLKVNLESILIKKPGKIISNLTTPLFLKDILYYKSTLRNKIDLKQTNPNFFKHKLSFNNIKELKIKYNTSINIILLSLYCKIVFESFKVKSLNIAITVGFKRTSETLQNGYGFIIINVFRSNKIESLAIDIKNKMKKKQYHIPSSSGKLIHKIPFNYHFTKKIREKIDICFGAIPCTKSKTTINNLPLIEQHNYLHTITYPLYVIFTTYGDVIFGTTHSRISSFIPKNFNDLNISNKNQI